MESRLLLSDPDQEDEDDSPQVAACWLLHLNNSGLSFNNMITHAPSSPKSYKEILLDQQVKSYHELVPPSLDILDNQVVRGATREEHDAKDEGTLKGHVKLW